MRSPSGEKYGLCAPDRSGERRRVEPVALPDPELVASVAGADVHEAPAVGRKGDVHAEDALSHRLTGREAHAVAGDGRGRACGAGTSLPRRRGGRRSVRVPRRRGGKAGKAAEGAEDERPGVDDRRGVGGALAGAVEGVGEVLRGAEAIGGELLQGDEHRALDGRAARRARLGRRAAASP